MPQFPSAGTRRTVDGETWVSDGSKFVKQETSTPPPPPRNVFGQLLGQTPSPWGNEQLLNESRAAIIDQTTRMGSQIARGTVEPVRAGVGALWEASRDPVNAAERGAKWAMNLFSGLGQSQADQLTKARDAATNGDFHNAVLHGGAYLSAVVGPMLDDMVSRVKNGQSAEVAGDLFTMFVLPTLVKKVPNVRTPTLNALGPKEKAATQWAVDQGVPLSAGEVTGNPMIKGAEYLAERGSLSGSVLGPRGANRASAGLSTIGEQLREKVNAGRGPRTALDAGEQIVDAMGPNGTVVKQFRADAKALYDQATAITGREAAFAVDMKSAQQQLRGLAKQLADSPEKLPLRGDLHEARRVLNEVLALDNTVPFMAAEQNALSPLKTIQRGFSKNSREWSVIQEAINAIDDQVMAGARSGGQGVEGLIKEARLKTAQMHEVIDENMAPESAARFGRKVMAGGDTGIETTRKIQQYAPHVLPDVGRAAIEEVFAPSLVKDGITKADSLVNRWNAVGAESKQAFFAEALAKDPNFLSDMDNFVLAASRAAEKANSSNSAGVVAGGVHLLNLLKLQNIPVALVQEGVGGLLTLLSRNPKVVRLMTRGFQLPTNAIAAKTANTAAIYKALGLATAPARAQGAGPVGGR